MPHEHDHDPISYILLREIRDEIRRSNVLLQKILEVEQSNNGFLSQIEINTSPPDITSFIITQKGDSKMALLPVAPGFSPVYTATPVPAGTFPAPGNVPVWSSSDTTNAPVTADATGLVATVAIPATAVVGTAFTLTVSYTNADGTLATGTLAQTIVAAPSPDITGFTIAQTT